MYKHKNIIYIAILIIFLLLLLVVLKSKEVKITNIKYDTISTKLEDNQYSLVHIGTINNIVKEIMTYMNESFEANLYNVSSAKDFDDNIEYLVYIKNKLVGTIESGKTLKEIEELLKKYYLNIIPESEVVYHNVEEFAELNKITNRNNLSIIVFGALDCSYCSLYKPIINKVAEDNKLDIYYIEKDVMNQSEYQQIRNIGFKVPGKCTTSGIETDTTKSISTPLTLIVKNNKTVDCILGYVKEEELIDLLKTNKLVK